MTDRAQTTLMAAIALMTIGLVTNLLVDAWQGGVAEEASGLAPPRFEVDLGRADVNELSLLPNIGPELARRIVDARRAGALASAEDLLAIRGIGPKTLAGLRSWIWMEPVSDSDSRSGEPGEAESAHRMGAREGETSGVSH